MATHRGLLHPAIEDFGITMVEAAAAGLPVLSPDQGGAQDAVVDGTTGLLYPEATVEGLMHALDRFEARRESWQAAAMWQHARGFGRSIFAARLIDELATVLGGETIAAEGAAR